VCTEADDDPIDLEHDDHATVHVLRGDGRGERLLHSAEECSRRLTGVVPGATVDIKVTGQLILDMGTGVVVAEAKRNLASGPQLCRAYTRVESSDDTIRYLHRTSKAELLFRKDPERFGDPYYHCLVGGNWAVSALDFYNPPPLTRVPEAEADYIWSQVRNVEHLHWATNHPGKAAMKDLCTNPLYEGPVSVEAIDYFYLHRGCSACGIGKMPAHAKIHSSRGLCAIVGKCAQGDLFYIETDRFKIPVLLLVDEGSRLIWLYAFMALAQRAVGPVVKLRGTEMKNAFTAALAVWASAGRSLTKLRFDREAASLDIELWLRGEGVELVPTAPGQKLGLVEVCGRIVKNLGRATLAGILERHGYVFPKSLYTKLTADVCAVLNRLPRTGYELSAVRMFFGTDLPDIDVRRDLRAAIGEVLLFKAPQKHVAMPMGTPKAEWGIVIGRKFNGSGVLEVLLLETNAIGHRFKFSRDHVIPQHVMDKLRTLHVSFRTNPPTREPDATPASPSEPPAPSGGAGDPQRSPVADEDTPPSPVSDGSDDEDKADEEAGGGTPEEVCAAQINYHEALKTSPVRAEAAFTKEVQSFMDRGLFHGVHFGDIPESDRSGILGSLDGYKEKYDQAGVFEKDKARVFATGSRQIDALTGDTYAPVCRIEALFMLVGIIAYSNLIVVRIDVNSAYCTVATPPEQHYKYLRLSAAITKIVVKLNPSYSIYVQANGAMIVRLDRMLYGMKEAGNLWHAKLFGCFTRAGFKLNAMDPCVIHKTSVTGSSHGAVNVDDALFGCTSEACVQEIIAMYSAEFGSDGFTVTRGDTLTHLGMLFRFDRDHKRVLISQPKFAADLVRDAGLSGTSPPRMPGGPDLHVIDPESPPLDPERRETYRSLNMSLMFAATRTYPECLPVASACASRFVNSTEDDWRKLLRGVSYLAHDLDHCLVIAPGSLSLVGSGDAAYNIHPGGQSQDGYCIGFRGRPAGGKSMPMRSPVLYQDNKSAIHLAVLGRGNFRNTKHIRVRYYFIRDLIQTNELIEEWQGTEKIVADMLSKGVSWKVFSTLLPQLIGRGQQCVSVAADAKPDSYFAFGTGKQSIVVKSSTEAELVTANRAAELLVWGSQLLEGFGIVATPSLLARKVAD
jgi:hypothetical protein